MPVTLFCVYPPPTIHRQRRYLPPLLSALPARSPLRFVCVLAQPPLIVKNLLFCPKRNQTAKIASYHPKGSFFARWSKVRIVLNLTYCHDFGRGNNRCRTLSITTFETGFHYLTNRVLALSFWFGELSHSGFGAEHLRYWGSHSSLIETTHLIYHTDLSRHAWCVHLVTAVSEKSIHGE